MKGRDRVVSSWGFSEHITWQPRQDKWTELLRAAKAAEKAWQWASISGNSPDSRILDQLSAAIRKCERKENV